jgi:hypothetical protein
MGFEAQADQDPKQVKLLVKGTFQIKIKACCIFIGNCSWFIFKPLLKITDPGET